MMPSLTVVIPTHNRLETLKRALHFLGVGSEIPDEIVVIDDGSTDAVEPHLSDAVQKFPSLRVIRLEPSRGSAVARNTGMRAATRDIVVLMDDDVFAEPTTIAAHRRLHAAHPEDTFGVMGRLVFDPELTYTPLMQWMETVGDFKSIANGKDGVLQPGLISANFSLKRAFIERQAVLFDESFTMYGNEDTEFGFRMVSSQGWSLRYHRAPGARHHSPMCLAKYWEHIYSSGISKTHWSLIRPDISRYSLNFGTAFLMKIREAEFRDRFRAVQDAFGESLDAPANAMPGDRWTQFDDFMRFSRQALQDIGQFDGWLELASAVSPMTTSLEAAFRATKRRDQLEHFESAYQCDPLFFPMAWLYAEQLCMSRQWEEADRVMKAFPDNNWALISRCSCAYAQRRDDECATIAREVLEGARAPLPDVIKQHTIASTWLERATAPRAVNRNETANLWRLGWFDGWYRRLRRQSRPTPQPNRATTLKTLLQQLLAVMQTDLPTCERGTLCQPATESRPVPCTRGTVNWYAPQKGFGFVRPARGDRMLMFDSTQLEHLDGESIYPGMIVTYTPVETQLGVEAHDLRRP